MPSACEFKLQSVAVVNGHKQAVVVPHRTIPLNNFTAALWTASPTLRQPPARFGQTIVWRPASPAPPPWRASCWDLVNLRINRRREKLCAMSNGVKTRFAGLLRELLRRFDENETEAGTPHPSRPLAQAAPPPTAPLSPVTPARLPSKPVVSPRHRRKPSPIWNYRSNQSWKTCRPNCVPACAWPVLI